MRIEPKLQFNKHDFGFGVACILENESAKYVRKKRIFTLTCMLIFLWFTVGICITVGE